jgi:putative ATPase
MGAVMDDMQKTIAEPVPLNLARAHGSHESLGLRRDYQHAHKFEDAIVDMECPRHRSPAAVYFPTDRGMEARIRERLEERRREKENQAAKQFQNRDREADI